MVNKKKQFLFKLQNKAEYLEKLYQKNRDQCIELYGPD
jgi:hypothetical protein